jgi:hypothetical protein
MTKRTLGTSLKISTAIGHVKDRPYFRRYTVDLVDVLSLDIRGTSM